MNIDLVPTIMSIGAHHDDNEMFAGTLAKHQQAGWRVICVVVTDGRMIGDVASEKHVPIRESESNEAAALLGCHCEFMRVAEGAAEPNEATRLGLVRLLRYYKPRLVITHPPHDYHLDHIWVSRAVFEAVHQCWNRAVEPEIEACPRPLLYYGDAWFVPFEPDEYVDIEDTIALKLRALSCHKSQLPQAGAEGCDEPSMLDLAELRARIRGVESGCRYAEAFRLAPSLGSTRLSQFLATINKKL